MKYSACDYAPDILQTHLVYKCFDLLILFLILNKTAFKNILSTRKLKLIIYLLNIYFLFNSYHQRSRFYFIQCVSSQIGSTCIVNLSSVLRSYKAIVWYNRYLITVIGDYILFVKQHVVSPNHSAKQTVCKSCRRQISFLHYNEFWGS